MKLEVGKRYVLRNGEVTEPLEETSDPVHKFAARAKNIVKRTWTESGHWLDESTDKDLDIVAEYVEPQPQQPLRWVENTKPDKPGIWAVLTMRGITYLDLFTENDVPSLHKADYATRCYLGPIPEILPPVKKVVERLFLGRLSSSTKDGVVKSTFIEHWHDDADPNLNPNADQWIRTDRTREREI